ncbi:MAG TPA: outer membrane lipoprotein carrier protein LolA [Phycisphaerae bacterium]|nr:outer membrane lipoprotein carrier protein LolA [Phycisphaerae bacterium]
MRRKILTTMCAMAMGLSCVVAGDAGPASQPPAATAGQGDARGDTRPTSAPAAQVEDVLKALEQAGEKYDTIKADVHYQVVNTAMDDKEVRTGWVAYQKAAAGGPAKFRVSFATLALDKGQQFEEKIDYAFDGRLLSIARHRIKQINRYRIADDQQRQPMKLGQGPFPLPFGQKAQDMLERFDITTRPVRDDEPKNSDYLRLVPKGEGDEQANLTQIEMWVDRGTHLPVRIVSAGKDKNVTTVVLSETKTDVKLDGDVFTLSKPRGWRETIENFAEGTKLAP